MGKITENINAGELNKQIVLMRKTVTRGDYNEENYSYSSLCTIWAKISKTSSNKTTSTESENDHRKNFKDSLTFEIRYINIPNLKDIKIYYKKRYYDIIYVNNVNEKNIKLILEAECIGSDLVA